MRKEDLKKNQPVVWQVLSNALTSQRLSHGYLFVGPPGAPLSQMALLLAQSLFCKHTDEEGFACTECEDCRRIAREESLDLYWAHSKSLFRARSLKKKEMAQYWKGEEVQASEQEQKAFRIRKETVLNLQESFSKSAAADGYQVYILEEYDTATPEASNSLLKFLEEPKDNLVGILTAHEAANILPTILSRVQVLTFRPANKASLEEEISQLVEDEASIQMLAANGYNQESVQDVLNEGFFEIRDAAMNYYPARHDYGQILRMQSEVFHSKSELYSKNNVRLFLQWLLWLARADQKTDPEKVYQIRMALLQAMDMLARPVDLALLLDQLYYKLIQI